MSIKLCGKAAHGKILVSQDSYYAQDMPIFYENKKKRKDRVKSGVLSVIRSGLIDPKKRPPEGRSSGVLNLLSIERVESDSKKRFLHLKPRHSEKRPRLIQNAGFFLNDSLRYKKFLIQNMGRISSNCFVCI